MIHRIQPIATWICVVLALLPLGGFQGCARECKPITTEIEARERIEKYFVEQERRGTHLFRVYDLSSQITDLSMEGPKMSFDHPDVRYATFLFDNGRGALERRTAMFNKCGGLGMTGARPVKPSGQVED